MTKERMFYIAYEVCDYMRNIEMQNPYEDYEFCMYVAEMVNNMDYAIKNDDLSVIIPYYEALYDELENLCGMDDCFTKKPKELICLLNEVRLQLQH